MGLKPTDVGILLQQGEGSKLEYKEAPSSSLARYEFDAGCQSGGGDE
jgi:hypothetical protein